MNTLSLFNEHGLIGLIIGALFVGLYFLLREHSEERKQWLQAYKENTEVLRTLTALTTKCGIKPIEHP